MAVVNGYATLADIRARLGITGTTATEDTRIEAAINATSRKIDRHCRRWFYASTATRYYTPSNTEVVLIDDLGTSGSLTVKTDDDGDGTYENTWATTDYHLWPFNSTPYRELRVAPNGNYSFPVGTSKGLLVTGSFGHNVGTSASAPADVREACAIQSIRLYKRADAPFGVTGSAEMGQLIVIPKLDPDVALLLAPFIRTAGPE